MMTADVKIKNAVAGDAAEIQVSRLAFCLCPLRRAIQVFGALLAAHRASFQFFLSIALCAQFPIGSHFSVVGEASVACAARLAALAASVESCFQVSPGMTEV